MKKIVKRKNIPEPTNLALPQAKTDLADLVNKICEQLVVLEKKVDSLISRSTGRVQGNDRFHKPGSRFRRSDGEGRLKERNFTQAVCSQCGKECELPFKPTGGRPVYCRDCFSTRKDPGMFKGNSTRERNFDNCGQAKGTRFGKKRGTFFQGRKGRS